MDEKYGSFANPYTYTGKELDSEVDLYYYGARYYNAGFSRFTSIDPALFDMEYLQKALSDPQRLNSFSYAKNNPMNYIDVNGEEPNKAQAATLDEIINKVGSTEENFSDFDYETKITEMYVAYKNATDNKANPRYVYTEKAGWIDMKHFFAAVHYSLLYNDTMTKIGGFFIEIRQLFGEWESAFSYEDLPSNNAGLGFAELLKELERQNLTDSDIKDLLKVYLQDLGITDPENAPNYNNLPDAEKANGGGSSKNSNTSSEKDSVNDKKSKKSSSSDSKNLIL